MWEYVCWCVPENHAVFRILVIFVPERQFGGRQVCKSPLCGLDLPWFPFLPLWILVVVIFSSCCCCFLKGGGVTGDCVLLIEGSEKVQGLIWAKACIPRTSSLTVVRCLHGVWGAWLQLAETDHSLQLPGNPNPQCQAYHQTGESIYIDSTFKTHEAAVAFCLAVIIVRNWCTFSVTSASTMSMNMLW